MHVEEEHREWHKRGELIKFLILAGVLLTTVLVVALARPLIFGHVVPAVMGWNQPPMAPDTDPGLIVPPAITPALRATPTSDGAAATVVPAVESGEEAATAVPTAATTTEAGETTAETQSYVVRSGDNLTTIARRFNVAVEDIIRLNGLANPNRISAGDVLLIPAP